MGCYVYVCMCVCVCVACVTHYKVNSEKKEPATRGYTWLNCGRGTTVMRAKEGFFREET